MVIIDAVHLKKRVCFVKNWMKSRRSHESKHGGSSRRAKFVKKFATLDHIFLWLFFGGRLVLEKNAFVIALRMLWNSVQNVLLHRNKREKQPKCETYSEFWRLRSLAPNMRSWCFFVRKFHFGTKTNNFVDGSRLKHKF